MENLKKLGILALLFALRDENPLCPHETSCSENPYPAIYQGWNDSLQRQGCTFNKIRIFIQGQTE
ncbi:MAG: hypothetical protein ACRC10_12905 [Thermoguttaceae bacterium]